MTFDYKKEYKEFYLPAEKPEMVTVPSMNFAAVRGKGNPNDADGGYSEAMRVLYGIAYTIKMSKMGDHRIKGYFDYVVPPLEGFWWQEKDGVVVPGFDCSDKDAMCWISLIRLPDFVTKTDFDWAVAEAAKKKKEDFSKAVFFTFDEGLCVQAMHIGPYDDEPGTIAGLKEYAASQGYVIDINAHRFHHEIYLSDPRKTVPEKLKTVIRYPIAKMETDRILLRSWNVSDAENLLKYASDPEMGPRAGWPPHKSVKESLEAIKKFFLNDTTWAVVLKETGEIIGCVGYHTAMKANITIEEDQAEVGYWIAKPFWNQGFCTEALKLVVDRCISSGCYNVLFGTHFTDNPASGRVMEKCGFVETGERRTCPGLEVGADKEVRVLKRVLKMTC